MASKELFWPGGIVSKETDIIKLAQEQIAGMLAAHSQQLSQCNENMAAQQALSGQQLRAAYQQGIALGSYTPKEKSKDYGGHALRLFVDRMGGVRQSFKLTSADFLMCHAYGEDIYLFFMLGGKDGVVHEPMDLFPSDQLITQFKLLTSA